MRQYTGDERVISAFLANYRTVDIIRETGLSKSTVLRLKKDQAFQQTLQARKAAILSGAIEKLRGYLIADVEVLHEIIADKTQNAQARIYAINSAWSAFNNWTQLADFESRLAALENPQRNEFTTIDPGETGQERG